jgi:rhodanese-related sulfurtransferase
VDIRSAEDFETKRINGSRNFPKMSVFGSLAILRRDLSVFVVDSTDSLLVKRFSRKLIRKGFIRVYTLKGGLDKWPFGFKE